MKRMLVTGGAGFVGANFIDYVLERGGYQVVNLDLLTYAGNLENLRGVENHPNYEFVKGSICDAILMKEVLETGIDVVVNFAAESHVDRSILDPTSFVKTNVLGTQVLLTAALNAWQDRKDVRFHQVSTDEVYGSLGPEGLFSEESPLSPTSPYAASKTSADLLVMAHFKTFGLPVTISRCSNNYGPYQFPEKLIPLMILNTLKGKALPIYGDGLQVRDWIHVFDHCRAILAVIERGQVGEIYNVGGNQEVANIDIVKRILTALGKDESLIEYVKDRLGHDRRYGIDAEKIRRELGWAPLYDFEAGISETIDWYLNNEKWLSNVQSDQYRQYYDMMYSKRDSR